MESKANEDDEEDDKYYSFSYLSGKDNSQKAIKDGLICNVISLYSNYD